MKHFLLYVLVVLAVRAAALSTCENLQGISLPEGEQNSVFCIEGFSIEGTTYTYNENREGSSGFMCGTPTPCESPQIQSFSLTRRWDPPCEVLAAIPGLVNFAVEEDRTVFSLPVAEEDGLFPELTFYTEENCKDYLASDTLHVDFENGMCRLDLGALDRVSITLVEGERTIPKCPVSEVPSCMQPAAFTEAQDCEAEFQSGEQSLAVVEDIDANYPFITNYVCAPLGGCEFDDPSELKTVELFVPTTVDVCTLIDAVKPLSAQTVRYEPNNLILSFDTAEDSITVAGICNSPPAPGISSECSELLAVGNEDVTLDSEDCVFSLGASATPIWAKSESSQCREPVEEEPEPDTPVPEQEALTVVKTEDGSAILSLCMYSPIDIAWDIPTEDDETVRVCLKQAGDACQSRERTVHSSCGEEGSSLVIALEAGGRGSNSAFKVGNIFSGDMAVEACSSSGSCFCSDSFAVTRFCSV